MRGLLVASAATAATAVWLAGGTAQAAEDDLTLDLGGIALELRPVPKGKFTEGSPPTEAGREFDETPRTVTITRPFWLGKVPVTRAQFARFVSETRHVTDAEKGQSGGFGWDAKTGVLAQRKDFTWRNPGFVQKDDEPVVMVTFGDASAFVAWASRKTGRRVRLPTEAEWEYAARAGTTTPWYAATKEEDAANLGWFKANASSSTHSVGLKRANAFGLFDMSGNVYEWCRDIYAPYPPGDTTDPEATTNVGTEPERRVLRGGSWLKDPKRARSAARYRNAPGSRNADNGFRVAVEDDPLALPPSGVPSGDFPSALPLPLGSSTPGFGPDASVGPAVLAPPPLRASEGISWALLAAPAGAAGAAVAWVLARRKRTPPNARGIGTRAQDDGFWVHARGLPQGTRVRYSCVVDGVDVSDVVPLDGGDETFVYTGSRPSGIRITEVVAAAAVPAYRAPARLSLEKQSETGPVAPRVTGPPSAPVVRVVTPMPPSPLRPPSTPPRPSASMPISTSLPASRPPMPAVIVEPIEPFEGYPRAY
jgi:formylglycine-generating enzyme required for sulfatase activity